jgi:hypothetical protein
MMLFCGLAAIQSWGGSEACFAVAAAEVFARPSQGIVTNNSADLANSYGASLEAHPSLDLRDYQQTGVSTTTMGMPQNWPESSDGDSARQAASDSSFILIGLGGGVLICLCWKMTRPPQPDSTKAK